MMSTAGIVFKIWDYLKISDVRVPDREMIGMADDIPILLQVNRAIKCLICTVVSHPVICPITCYPICVLYMSCYLVVLMHITCVINF